MLWIRGLSQPGPVLLSIGREDKLFAALTTLKDSIVSSLLFHVITLLP